MQLIVPLLERPKPPALAPRVVVLGLMRVLPFLPERDWPSVLNLCSSSRAVLLSPLGFRLLQQLKPAEARSSAGPSRPSFQMAEGGQQGQFYFSESDYAEQVQAQKQSRRLVLGNLKALALKLNGLIDSARYNLQSANKERARGLRMLLKSCHLAAQTRTAVRLNEQAVESMKAKSAEYQRKRRQLEEQISEETRRGRELRELRDGLVQRVRWLQEQVEGLAQSQSRCEEALQDARLLLAG